MGTGSWKLGGASPFLTERAQARAPQVLAYAAVAGAAMIVSATGEIVLSSGEAIEVDLARIARIAASCDAVRSFRHGTICVHIAPISRGWSLCVLSTAGVQPMLVVERLRRASYVLALALIDGMPPNQGGPNGEGGAPAELFARIDRKSRV